ncbi:hypothetical protein [Psychromonas ossibalaenae]|uniref:hypothetical protein n=1 Tax=Psychromonas ossibalaenae TaxID=444922 RepID=UPI000366CF9C|nr:hypothetical protein [Psychromonas ossibalaenae]
MRVENNNPTTNHQGTALLIGVDMASGPDKSIVTVLNRAKYFADKAQSILNKRDDGNTKAIHSMVNSIMTLAMLNDEVLHIFVRYVPHTKEISVRVLDARTDYDNKQTELFTEHVYLDEPQSLDHLKLLEDLLIELVGQAKDKAMGAV